jgi:hypothetical protein
MGQLHRRNRPGLDPEVFRHGICNAHMIAVPERLQERVRRKNSMFALVASCNGHCRKSPSQKVLNKIAEFLRRGRVCPEGLSTMTRAPLVQPAVPIVPQPAQHRRWNGEACAGRVQSRVLTDGLKGRRVFVVAINIAQQSAEFIESRSLNSSSVFLKAFPPGPELVMIPTDGHTEDRHAGGRA